MQSVGRNSLFSYFIGSNHRDPKSVKTDSTIGTSRVNGTINAWLEDWQLGIDGPFQHMTGVWVKGQRGGGCFAANAFRTRPFFMITLVPVPREAGGIN